MLATVKSFLGSRGVVAEEVMGTSSNERANRRYALLNDSVVRDAVLAGASQRYDYPPEEIEFRLYVGKFAGARSSLHARGIRAWCTQQIVGAGLISVHGRDAVALAARQVANSKTYRDNPALVAIKVLEAAGMLTPL